MPTRESSPLLARGLLLASMLASALICSGRPALGQGIEGEPIRYSVAKPRNRVSRLQDGIASGTTRLKYEPEHGYLRSVLHELDIPESSQVLVFSKTSLQRDRISPSTPRAIYFNDDVMVGYCQKGRVIELSAADEVVGTAFYTIDQSSEPRSVPQQQTDSCLICHGSSVNQGIPGHLVRSLFVDKKGNPLIAGGVFRVEHSTPLDQRWGGWYVTGTSGSQMHLGNLLSESSKRPSVAGNTSGVNLLDLNDRFAVAPYLTPDSDIVALMVLEHQVGMLNRLARAGIETRMALFQKETPGEVSDRVKQARAEEAQSRIEAAAESVLSHMLMTDEVVLKDRIKGTSRFAHEFAARGPRDSKGRSLRDFDLQTRLFRYPCSYLIHSRAFDSLPAELETVIYRRLWDVLNGKGSIQGTARLNQGDRQAILEILRETLPNLPDSWRKSPAP